MKIFSNFDSTLRQKTFVEYQESYGADNVLCFGRSKLYRIYKVILPLLLVAAVCIFALIFLAKRLDGEYLGYIFILLFIFAAFFIVPAIGKYIDYKMDFIIVVPNSIMMYDQWGLLKRNVITISTQSIKSISIKKSWLLYSIFDNGDIIILTEGDTERNGEIKLRRIPRPEKRKNQIVKVIGIDFEANQNPKI